LGTEHVGCEAEAAATELQRALQKDLFNNTQPLHLIDC
jgi:hypothetical protein